jgi:hypothetical protein
MFKKGDKVRVKENFKSCFTYSEAEVKKVGDFGIDLKFTEEDHIFTGINPDVVELVVEPLKNIDMPTVGCKLDHDKELLDTKPPHKFKPFVEELQTSGYINVEQPKSTVQKTLEFLLEALKTGDKFTISSIEGDIIRYDINCFRNQYGVVKYFNFNELLEWYAEPKKIVRYDAKIDYDFEGINFYDREDNLCESICLKEIKQDAKGFYIEREE